MEFDVFYLVFSKSVGQSENNDKTAHFLQSFRMPAGLLNICKLGKDVLK